MPVQIDIATIAVADISLTALIGAVLLFVWLQNRSSRVVGWWGVAHLCQSAGLVLLVAGEITRSFPGARYAPALVLTSYALMWIGARQFDGRPTRFLMTFSGVFFWLFVALIISSPTATQDYVLYSAINSVYCFAIAFEIWRGREEPLMSRWPAIVLLSLSGAGFFSWMIMFLLLPGASDISVLPVQWFGYVILITLLGKTALAFIILAMAKERLELRQRKEALTDPLTGLPNRRAFFRLALRRMPAQDAGGPMSLLMMDLDRFKAINDRYGHAIGDRVLVIFAEILSERIKATDVIGRVGGEEFAVLLPDTDIVSAEVVAERLRLSFAEKAATVDGIPLRATVSIGVASCEAGEGDLHSLLGQADRALYAAKRAGRNCIRLPDAANQRQPHTTRPPRAAA